MSVEDTKHLREDLDFTPLHDYPSTLHDKRHPLEYGMIKTRLHDYHILVGHIPLKGCPWCGSDCVIKTEDINDIFELAPLNRVHCFKVCKKCGAEGPKIKINFDMLKDKTAMGEVEYLLERNFQTRIAWFDQLDLGEKND
jgi:hypothetical protein